MSIGVLKHRIIDLYRGTNVVRDFKNIRSEVALGPEFLNRFQKQRLAQLLLHSRQHVRFYRNFLSNVRIDDITNHPFEVHQTLPYITKEDIINNTNEFVSEISVRSITNNTGGSTGDPLTYQVDFKCVSRTRAFDLYWWNQAFGYRFGDRVLTIGGSSIGNSKSLQLKIYNYLQSKSFLEGGNISAEALEKNVQIICNGKYDVIYAYPSALMLYVESAKARGMKFRGRLKGIATTSENLTSAIRLSIEAFFGAKVFDVYGARDGGIVADECKLQTGLHYNFQDCYVEEFSESEEQLVPELVLTNLKSYSQPMIRYRVGDLGRVSGVPCKCGNPLPRIVDFSGRTRDLLALANGRIIHGSLFNKIVSSFPAIKQYQTIYDHNTLKFIMVVAPGLSSDEEKQFNSKVQDLTGVEEIIIDYSGSFEYTDAGKLKTVVTKKG